LTAAKPSVREPKQERSRQSFDKALDAAVALMVERGSDAFTLAEVAKRAGVSIGSIYGRVDSRDDLLRTAHAREMERIQALHRQAFDTPRPVGCPCTSSGSHRGPTGVPSRTSCSGPPTMPRRR
jgi:AcrR family transcriptional regulator